MKGADGKKKYRLTTPSESILIVFFNMFYFSRGGRKGEDICRRRNTKLEKTAENPIASQSNTQEEKGTKRRYDYATLRLSQFLITRERIQLTRLMRMEPKKAPQNPLT
jgi:hypothetical protein